VDQEENLLNFHSLVPVPEEILAPGYDNAGHLWEAQNWGCKWGACETRILDEGDGLVVYQFDTPWSPPLQFLKRVAKQFPGLTFLLDYEEQSMGFKGIARFKDEAKEDHCIHY
jgi:Ferredoxin-like domain in Api92-like protein